MNTRLIAKYSGKLATYIVLLAGVYIMLVPFMWMITTAFKTLVESTRIPIQWLPDGLFLGNFEDVFRRNVGLFYTNTITVTVGITVAQIITASLAGYAFARIKFPFSNVLFFLILCMLLIPPQMTLIPRYVMAVNLGIVNTLMGIIAPSMISVTMTFFMRQVFLTFPNDLEDAARIDGCSHFGIYWRIALPLSTSMLVSMAILVALFAWNDLLWPLVVANQNSSRVLSVFIASIPGEHSFNMPVMMAAGVISVIPMIILFIVGQKFFHLSNNNHRT
jgi:multiple sugar transport system permease protein